MNFPDEFLIGTATAAHQVEGNNIYSDFWAMEQMKHSMFAEPSKDAVDHYHHYEEDIRLMAESGLNAYRFSIEWARIQPTEEEWNETEIDHYRKVLLCCHENGITPIVTMHHFSSPKWLISSGGWENPQTAELFAAYCKRVIEELGNLMEYVCTINEANMGVQIAHMMQDENDGKNTENVQVGLSDLDHTFDFQAAMQETAETFGCDPTKLNIFLFPRSPEGDKIIIDAHKKARDAMKEVCPKLKIGMTLSLYDIQTIAGGEKKAAEAWEEDFGHYLPAIKNDDFIGVQNYTRKIMGANGAMPVPEGSECTQMGYEYYPQGIAHVVRRVAEVFKGEILVTENGIATDNDERRVEFIRVALEGLLECIEDGIKLKGYMHWSFVDNFEWMAGYVHTFGLVKVDRKTQTRYPKPSLKLLGSMAKGEKS